MSERRAHSLPPFLGGMANFSFDSRNRLMSAGNTVYRYDAENQRIGVNVDGQETRYVINSQSALSQVLVRTKADDTQTYYVYGLGLIGQEQDGEYLTYHFDLRGSTVALTNETGIVTELFQYSPYGVLVSGNAEITPFLFNGMYGVMTDGNGLYYMRARYYNPITRRFVNQDVLLGNIAEGQTLNRYGFVTGKPINSIDPEGKWVVPVLVWGIGAALFLYEIFSPIEPDLSGSGAVEEVWTIPGSFRAVKPLGKACKGWTNIRGTQVGFGNPKQIDQIKADMLAGKYEYTEPKGRIGGWVDSNGNFYVGEGHHRMAAAMEIYKETGDDRYIKKLLEQGLWSRTSNPPPDNRPFPSRDFWDNLRNLLGF